MATTFAGAGDALDGTTTIRRRRGTGRSSLPMLGALVVTITVAVLSGLSWASRAARGNPALLIDGAAFAAGVAGCAALWGHGGALLATMAALLILNAQYGPERR